MRAATRERMISIMARGLVISVLTKKVTYTFTIVRSKKRRLQRSELWTVDTAAPASNPKKLAECKLALRQKLRMLGLCRRFSALRLCRGLCLFISFCRKFLGHSLLEFLSIHSIAFGGVHENVVAASGGPLIRRIQQANFQKQFAEFGLVVGSNLLDQKFLCGGRVFLRLYLVPLRQSRDLAVGEM